MTIEISDRKLAQVQKDTIRPAHSEIHLMQQQTMSDGFLNRYGVREGLELLIFDFTLEQPINATVTAQTGMILSFLLSGDGMVSFTGSDGETSSNSSQNYQPDLAIIAYSEDVMQAQSLIRASTPLSRSGATP